MILPQVNSQFSPKTSIVRSNSSVMYVEYMWLSFQSQMTLIIFRIHYCRPDVNELHLILWHLEWSVDGYYVFPFYLYSAKLVAAGSFLTVTGAVTTKISTCNYFQDTRENVCVTMICAKPSAIEESAIKWTQINNIFERTVIITTYVCYVEEWYVYGYYYYIMIALRFFCCSFFAKYIVQ